MNTIHGKYRNGPLNIDNVANVFVIAAGLLVVLLAVVDTDADPVARPMQVAQVDRHVE